ncbi:MAG: hypothetical protein AAF449_12010 [Myxococcota bacterium]
MTEIVAAFDTLGGQPGLLILVVAGALAAAVAVLLSLWNLIRLDQQADHLLSLATAGRADEARIQARQGAKDLEPMRVALRGVLSPPSTRPIIRDLVAIIIVLAFPVLTVIAGWQASISPVAAERVIGVSASFTALAILLPITIIASALVITLGRRRARAIRGAAVQLLSRTVKATVDAEFAEALRRGNLRDPRSQ